MAASSLFGGGSKPTVGFRYFFAIHMGIGRGPVDELVEIKVGDKTAWRGSVIANTTVQINAREIFGGDRGEGGVEGPLTVLMGGPTQVAPAAMTQIFGPQPGFRRMFTLFFDGLVSAMNPYPKKWAVRHRRVLAGWDGVPWYPERAVITLVRPASEGETGNSTEGAIAQGVETFRFQLPSPFVYTINVGRPVINVGNLSFRRVSPQGFIDDVPLQQGVHYNISFATTIQLTPAGEQFVAGGDDVAVSQTTFIASYSYSLSTTSPGGGDLGDVVIRAMNPAHIVYECLTNREWGRGLPRNKLDDASFRDCADKLFNEQFGLCLRWRRRDEIQVFIQSVLDHIGATLYEDRTTGLLRLRLVRDDYVSDLLPLFDTENGLLEITEATVAAASKMINEVRVTYRDPVTNEDRVVRSSNLATLQASGGAINILSKNFAGIPTGELASRVAKRELRAVSPGLRRFNLTFDRRANNLIPGGVVRIQDLQRNVPDMVLRIATIDYGTLTNGRIKVTAVQDVFDTPREGFTVIGPPTWVPPSSRACVGDFRLYELPYRTLYRTLPRPDFNLIQDTSAYLGLALDRGTGNANNVLTDMAVKSGAIDPSEQPPSSDFFCGYTP